MIRVLILAIDYRSNRQAVTFLRSLRSQSLFGDIATVMVDNAAHENGGDGLAQCLVASDILSAGTHVLTPDANLGYFGGANFALTAYLRQHDLPEWTIVCNVDVIIPDHDFFARLFANYAMAPPAVVAPSIILERSGRDQNPYLRTRPTRRRIRFLELVYQHRLSGMLYEGLASIKQQLHRSGRHSELDRSSGFRPYEVYAGHGSFIIFHKTYFEAGGNLRHGAFLFGEELFVGETVRRLALRAVFDARLRVLHRGSNPVKAIQRPELMAHMRDATAFLAKTYWRSRNVQ